MSVPLEAPLSPWTVADLARRFGPLPAWRVVMDPPPGAATEEDVDAFEQQSGVLCELINGILVRKTMGACESLLAVTLVSLLHQFVKPRRLGWVLGEAGMLRLWPGRVRIPDACFIAAGQTADGVFPRHERVATLYPDFAIEVLSDTNTPGGDGGETRRRFPLRNAAGLAHRPRDEVGRGLHGD